MNHGEVSRIMTDEDCRVLLASPSVDAKPRLIPYGEEVYLVVADGSASAIFESTGVPYGCCDRVNDNNERIFLAEGSDPASRIVARRCEDILIAAFDQGINKEEKAVREKYGERSYDYSAY